MHVGRGGQEMAGRAWHTGSSSTARQIRNETRAIPQKRLQLQQEVRTAVPMHQAGHSSLVQLIVALLCPAVMLSRPGSPSGIEQQAKRGPA
jgi:hypothetical protein